MMARAHEISVELVLAGKGFRISGRDQVACLLLLIERARAWWFTGNWRRWGGTENTADL